VGKQKKRQKDANIIRCLKDVFKKFPVVSITPQKKKGEGAYKECNIDTMELLGTRVKLI